MYFGTELRMEIDKLTEKSKKRSETERITQRTLDRWLSSDGTPRDTSRYAKPIPTKRKT